MRIDKCRRHATALAAAILILPVPVFAQQSNAAATAAGSEESAPTNSGYTVGDSLEGGDSIMEDLAQDDLDLGSMVSFPRMEQFFDPWFDTKRRLNENYGLKFASSYQVLYQQADDSPGEDNAAGSRVEIGGAWTLVGRNTNNPGLLSFQIASLNTLGTEIPPSQLGGQFGSVTQVGKGFSDAGTALLEMTWRQTLFDGRMKFAAGKISATSWYNGHVLSSSKRGFQNLALQTSVTKPSTGRGIGVGAVFRLGTQFGLLVGIHDANARSVDNPFDTIDEGEFYKSLEFRWFPTTYDRRRKDQVRVQFWHQDERVDAGVPSGQGVTVLASRSFNDFWMPFVLGGVSDGDASIFKADLIAGIALGFHKTHRNARDVLAFAVGWGRPSDDALTEQYTGEVFYRFQLFERLAITASVQLIVNPAASQEKTEVWVVGTRVRMTF